MSENESLNAEQREVEALLGHLVPKQPAIDVAALMYQAGQESILREQRGRVRRWQLSTFVSTAAAVTLAVLVARGSTSAPEVPNVIAETPSKAFESEDQQQPVIEEQPEEIVAPEETAVAVNDPPAEPTATPGWWRFSWNVSAPVSGNYLALRSQVLEHGVDSLPVNTTGGSETRKPLTSFPGNASDLFTNPL